MVTLLWLPVGFNKLRSHSTHTCVTSKQDTIWHWCMLPTVTCSSFSECIAVLCRWGPERITDQIVLRSRYLLIVLPPKSQKMALMIYLFDGPLLKSDQTKTTLKLVMHFKSFFCSSGPISQQQCFQKMARKHSQ